jgi:hypothetical protein
LSSAAVAPAQEQHRPVPHSSESTRGFRLIPRIEADPQIIAFAQTLPGKLTLLAVFGLALSTMAEGWILAVNLGVVLCTTFFPRARRLLVTAGTLLLTDFYWFEHGLLKTQVAPSVPAFSRVTEFFVIILPFILLCAGLMWFSAKYPISVIGRRPVLVLLGICAALAATASYAPLFGLPRFAVWAFLDTLCIYIWYLAYAMADCAKRAGDNLLAQAGTFHPFWGSTGVPLPKGSSYWRKIEAKTPADLAVTMIKGVKLMAWCLLLSFMRSRYVLLIHHRLAIPSPSDCILAFQSGKPLSWARNWLCWPDDLLLELMRISIWGHALIATCRMAGFRALRNTYAPLSSRSIAEYWNRYYFYFKELLVDMFFYPTFLRCFKTNPRLRIFFATFVAASVGNTLFHLIGNLQTAVSFGLLTVIRAFQGYFFFSVLLALGIGISQIRSRARGDSRGWLRERILAPVFVVGFYCFVHVFEVTTPTIGLRYLGFLLIGR